MEHQELVLVDRRKRAFVQRQRPFLVVVDTAVARRLAAEGPLGSVGRDPFLPAVALEQRHTSSACWAVVAYQRLVAAVVET